MMRAQWALVVSLVVAACDETPLAPPGGFRDVADVDPDGETEAPEPAECEQIAADKGLGHG